MKHKLLTVVFVAAVLAALMSCDTGTPPTVPTHPESPITFTGNWKTTADSVNSIVRGPRYLTVDNEWNFVYTGGDLGDFTLGTPTELIGSMMAAQGGFSQARQEIDSNQNGFNFPSDPYDFYYYPPIIVEGKLIYVGDGYYDFAPQSGRIDLRMLKTLSPGLPDYTELPDSTVQNFKEYANISLNASNQLVVDDHPDRVSGGIGFLNGTWDKQEQE